MTRGELLNGVMKNYRRFYSRKALFNYPWRGTGFRRRYLLGCLYAFIRAGFKRSFYDLGKAGYWGPQSKNKVDFHFDDSRHLAEAQLEDWEASADKAAKAAERREAIKAQGLARAEDRMTARVAAFRMPNGAEVGPDRAEPVDEFSMVGAGAADGTKQQMTDVKACGGGDQQMEDA